MYSQTEFENIIINAGYEKECTGELFVFYNLLQKFNSSVVKDIYSFELFEKYFEILKKIDLVNYLQNETTFEINNSKLKKIFSINDDWIKYFVTLAETKNLSIAAKKLNITSSALSQSIKGIEEDLQVILIERDKNFGELTFVGKMFFEKCKKILKNLHDLSNTFDEMKFGLPHGEIKIAWFYTWGKDIIFKTIKNFIHNYPEVNIKLNYIPGYYIEKSISDGIYDIGFLPYEPTDKYIDIAGVMDIEYAIVSSPQAEKKWDELNYIVNCNNLGLISQNNISGSWPENEFKRNIILECNYLAEVIEFCKSGIGASFVPVSFVKKELEEGSLCIVAEPPFNKVYKLYLIYNKELFITSALKVFIRNMKENLKLSLGNNQRI